MLAASACWIFVFPSFTRPDPALSTATLTPWLGFHVNAGNCIFSPPAQIEPPAQEYFKKLEQERFEADLKQAQEAIAHMGTRLHTLESGNHDGLVVELDEDLSCVPFAWGRFFPTHQALIPSTTFHFWGVFEDTAAGVV